MQITTTPILQVELIEDMPLSNRLKEMSSRIPGSSLQTPSRSVTSSPASSGPSLLGHHAINRQPSLSQDVVAAVPAYRRHDSNLSKTAQSARHQATARQGPAKGTLAVGTGKAAHEPSGQKAAPQAELTSAELKALARRLKAAKQAGQAPQTSTLDRATASASGHSAAGSSGKAGPSSMGPLAARGKRPPLPERSVLPPKKRRATEAVLSIAQGQPTAAAQVLQGDTRASKPASAIPNNKVCYLGSLSVLLLWSSSLRARQGMRSWSADSCSSAKLRSLVRTAILGFPQAQQLIVRMSFTHAHQRCFLVLLWKQCLSMHPAVLAPTCMAALSGMCASSCTVVVAL